MKRSPVETFTPLKRLPRWNFDGFYPSLTNNALSGLSGLWDNFLWKLNNLTNFFILFQNKQLMKLLLTTTKAYNNCRKRRPRTHQCSEAYALHHQRFFAKKQSRWYLLSECIIELTTMFVNSTTHFLISTLFYSILLKSCLN